ncbi:MAG TPA: hypothetical protein VEY30_05225 [Myxococcaceae bacterium]|nr:hypothetical protein [Myxococcaceae bacterium]
MNQPSLRWVETRRGLRLLHGRHTVSEVLAQPGPTHSVFDVLGACAALLAPGPRVAVLGFAAGGLMAPLRALGSRARVFGVDLSLQGAQAFERVSGSWAGAYDVKREDAAAYLRRQRSPFDLIIEDLSEQIPGDVTKPSVSIEALPELISGALAIGGVAVFNVLPVPGLSTAAVVRRMAAPFPPGACLISFEEFDNRILIAGAKLPAPRELSRILKRGLRAIGSRQAERVRLGAL